MPIYEYRRPDGSTFELVQSFSDEPLTHDPDTGVPVERVLHPPAVHFKGKGFYNTDYGTRKRQRETAAASSEGSSESGGEGAKADKGDGAKAAESGGSAEKAAGEKAGGKASPGPGSAGGSANGAKGSGSGSGSGSGGSGGSSGRKKSQPAMN
jgi:putative FmdB family regulatory protein